VMVIYTPSPIVASEIAPRTPSWRDTLPIHPAANLFPRIADAELRELGTDIRKNGLLSPIVLWRPDKDAPVQLLDGRSRLDALELALGRPVRVTTRSGTWRIETDEDGKPVLVTDLIAEESGGLDQAAVVIFCGDDPYAYAASANVHRRHLTIEQKRELKPSYSRPDRRSLTGRSPRRPKLTTRRSRWFAGKPRDVGKFPTSKNATIAKVVRSRRTRRNRRRRAQLGASPLVHAAGLDRNLPLSRPIRPKKLATTSVRRALARPRANLRGSRSSRLRSFG